MYVHYNCKLLEKFHLLISPLIEDAHRFVLDLTLQNLKISNACANNFPHSNPDSVYFLDGRHLAFGLLEKENLTLYFSTVLPIKGLLDNGYARALELGRRQPARVLQHSASTPFTLVLTVSCTNDGVVLLVLLNGA